MPSPDPVGAESIGYLVRPWEPVRGTVHSSYDTAINLSLGSLWCSLVPARVPDGPASIRIPEQRWPLMSAVQRGDRVALRGASLRVGVVRIDLRTAGVWRPTVGSLRVVAGIGSRLAQLRHAADRSGGARWISPQLGSVLESDAPGLGELIRPLIGRGIGLTPAGDDALVGAMAASWLLRDQSRRAAALHIRLASAVRANLHRTTDLSAAFLAMAGEGHFQRPLLAAAVAVVGGGTPVESLALLRVGATSGADCALGLACAAQHIIQTQPNKVAA